MNPSKSVDGSAASLDMLPPTDQPETHMLDVSAQPGGAAGLTGADNVNYTKFTSQSDLGNFLIDHYRIRKPNELASCEVCHR